MGTEIQAALVAAIAALLVGVLTATPGLIIAVLQLRKDTSASLYQLLELKDKELKEARECCDKYRQECIELTELVASLQGK